MLVINSFHLPRRRPPASFRGSVDRSQSMGSAPRGCGSSKTPMLPRPGHAVRRRKDHPHGQHENRRPHYQSEAWGDFRVRERDTELIFQHEALKLRIPRKFFHIARPQNSEIASPCLPQGSITWDPRRDFRTSAAARLQNRFFRGGLHQCSATHSPSGHL
jgi:hypothetical protein